MSDIYDDEAAKIVERVTCGERQPPTRAGIKRVLAMAMEHAVNLAVTEIREGRAAGEVVEVTAGRPADCANYSPPGFSGHWRDWHRGHGCDLDPDAAKAKRAAAMQGLFDAGRVIVPPSVAAAPTGTVRDLGQWTADGDDLLDDTPATLTSHGFQVDVIPRFGSRGKQSAMARTIAALLNAAPPPAPAVPATPPDASRAIAKMLGKLDDEDKATFNWLCAGVRELHAVPATNATVPDALALVESVRAEMGRAFEDADHAERAHAMADGLRAAVEAMARDNARLMKERDELRALRQGYEDAREILTRRVFEAEAELAAVRARVAELESEIQRVHNALPFVSAPDGVPDAAAGVRVLAAELAALKERATIIDARLAAAVESVSTSASMTDDEWVPAILPGKVQ